MYVVELEIGLTATASPGTYAIQLRHQSPKSDIIGTFDAADPPLLTLDFVAQLASLADDPTTYGRQLHAALFEDPRVVDVFARARYEANDNEGKLRVRLKLPRASPELHGLCWEAIGDPRNPDRPLAGARDVMLSRSVGLHYNETPRPYQPRSPGRRLRALAVIPNGSNLDSYGLSALDPAAELARAKSALGKRIHCSALVSSADGPRVTLGQLRQALASAHDILLFIGHGKFADERAILLVEDDSGGVAPITADQFCDMLRELAQPPALVFLVACQSAGEISMPSQTLAAFGPRLVALGIPAVIAMQGSIEREIAAQFMELVFRDLAQHGIVDAAVSAARRELGSRAGENPKLARSVEHIRLPVLFMQLADGSLWQTGRSADDAFPETSWNSLVGFVKNDKCTPILGTDLLRALLGSSRELAERWAKEEQYPLELANAQLPQIAQYMVTYGKAEDSARLKLREALEQRVRELVADADADPWAVLFERSASLGPDLGATLDFYRGLATLPFRYYFTTCPDPLLETALARSGVAVETVNFGWRASPSDVELPPRSQSHSPSDANTVCHLFGSLEREDLLVISEDDHFQFLYNFAERKDMLSPKLRLRLSNSGLLFLGFRLEDWGFRVLLHALNAFEGAELRKRFTSVAIQLDAETATPSARKKAREYIGRYFGAANVNIYWGSPEEFIAELAERAR
jgi:hypothetical protein